MGTGMIRKAAWTLTEDVQTMNDLIPKFLNTIETRMQEDSRTASIHKVFADPSSLCILQIQLTKTLNKKSSVFSGSKFELAVIGRIVLTRSQTEQHFLEIQDSASTEASEADAEAPKMFYTVTCEEREGLAYHRSRSWEDTLDEKTHAKKGESIRVLRVSGLGGVTWAECEDCTFLPVEKDRAFFMLRS